MRLSAKGKGLLVAAMLLGALALSLSIATARGWTYAGPEDLPILEYRPLASEGASWGTLDHGTFTVEGTTYVAEVQGFREMWGAATHSMTLRIIRTEGDGARVWPASVIVASENGTGGGNAHYDLDAPRGAAVHEGAIEAPLGVRFNPGEHTVQAEIHLLVYREAAVGVVRQEDLFLLFEFPVSVRVPQD